jgi:hypothetical protein
MRYNPVPTHAHWLQVTDDGEFIGLVGHNDDGKWTYAMTRPISDPEAFVFTSRPGAARALRRHVHALRRTPVQRARAVG